MKNRMLFPWLLTLLLFACQSKPPVTETKPVVPPVGGSLYSEAHIDFAKVGLTSSCCEAKGTQVAIASGGPLSSQAGLEIFQSGGNLVDAAIAVAFALGVERPQSTGLGGGGFFTLHLKDKGDHVIDFRETAPAKSTQDMFLDEKGEVVPNLSTLGGLAIATPGFVAGMYDLHKKYGKAPWKRVLEPAIRLASEGFPISPTLAARIAAKKPLAEDAAAKKIFFEKGQPLQAGQILVQKDLAESLRKIAAKGKDAFYTGALARKIASEVKRQKGILSETDLKRYRAKFTDPLSTTYKGNALLSPPPPSSGGLVIGEILQILSAYDLKKEQTNPAKYLHLLAEAMKRGFADRSLFVGDPAFFNADYLSILSPTYAEGQRKGISMEKATPSTEIRPGAPLLPNTSGTTHLSLIDAEGNAISGTLSLNNAFGSAVMVPGTGIILNSTMDDFSAKPGASNLYGLVGAEGNIIVPGKRPVSSMTPMVVLNETTKAPLLALGGGGGSRIISSVLQVFVNHTDLYPGELKRSVFAPRIHHQWKPDELDLEPSLGDSIRAPLHTMGHTIQKPEAWIAEVQAVSFDPGTRQLTAVHDPRVVGGSVAK